MYKSYLHGFKFNPASSTALVAIVSTSKIIDKKSYQDYCDKMLQYFNSLGSSTAIRSSSCKTPSVPSIRTNSAARFRIPLTGTSNNMTRSFTLLRFFIEEFDFVEDKYFNLTGYVFQSC